MKFDRGLNGVDECKHLDIRVSHVPRGVKVAIVVKGVDRAEDVIPDQPVAGQSVRSIGVWYGSEEPTIDHLPRRQTVEQRSPHRCLGHLGQWARHRADGWERSGRLTTCQRIYSSGKTGTYSI